MNCKLRLFVFCFCFLSLYFQTIHAETLWSDKRPGWLEKAENAKPLLQYDTIRPLAVVKAVNDSTGFQNWRYETAPETISSFLGANLKTVNEITLDFGRHMTGYFTFHTKTLSRCQDAPVRIRFFFAELPAELNPPVGSLERKSQPRMDAR